MKAGPRVRAPRADEPDGLGTRESRSLTDNDASANDASASEPSLPHHATAASVFFSRVALIYVVSYAGQRLVGYLPGIGMLSLWWFSGLSAISHWTLQHVIGLPAHSPPVPSWYLDHRPDDLVELVRCLLVVGLAILAAATWTIARPRRATWERSPSWPYVVARFGLAGIMFGYAWAKLLPQQFNGGQVPLPWLLWRLGDFTPQHLLWIFMGYSRPYAIFAGAGEMLGAALLCFRRTSTAGAFVLIAVLSNVVVMNFAYDVPVKIDAVNFLLIAMFIAAPQARRVARAIFETRPQERTRATAYLQSIGASWITPAAAALLTLWLSVSPLRSISENLGGLYFSRPALPPHTGMFDVRSDTSGTSLDVAPQPWAHWRRLVISDRSVTALTAGDSLRRYSLTTDTLGKRMRLVPTVGTDRVLQFAYTRTESTVTLRSADGDSIALQRTQPTLLRWTHLWAW
jgi:hypothetical protein